MFIIWDINLDMSQRKGVIISCWNKTGDFINKIVQDLSVGATLCFPSP